MTSPTAESASPPEPAPETRLVLIRHGESQVTVDQVVGGPVGCIGLSSLGLRQAEALRDRWNAGHEPAIDVLWSSTMPRAIETAEAVNQTLGIELNTDVELEEWRPGDADGLPWSEVVRRWPERMSGTGSFTPWAPGGESLRDLHLRAGHAIDALVRTHEGQSIMCVVHAGVIDVAFRLLLNLAQVGGFHLWTRNTSITELVLSRPTENDFGGRTTPQWRLVRYNDASHIDAL